MMNLVAVVRLVERRFRVGVHFDSGYWFEVLRSVKQKHSFKVLRVLSSCTCDC